MNKKRPEYIKCIQHTHVDPPKTSWCGEKLFSFDWAFQDIDHAVYSVQQGSRQVPCPDCLKKIYEVLNETDPQPKYKNIPTEDWVRYPEIKPKESGYYFTVYQDYPDGKDVGNLFYKCIYWCSKREDWISWKSPFRETPHIFKVGCFIEKTRTDFYCPCIEKVEELYLKK